MVCIQYINLIWILFNLVLFNIMKLSVAPFWWITRAVYVNIKVLVITSYKNNRSINRKDIFPLLKNITLDVFIRIIETYNDIDSYLDQIHDAIMDINNYLNEVGWILLADWIGDTELKFKNKINNLLNIILNKKNHSVSYRLNLLYNKFKSLKLITKITIIYTSFLVIIRGATISELPSYSILYPLSKINPNIKLKVSTADIIWWKIKCFFIRNFTNMEEPENPAEIRAKEIMKNINKNRRLSDFEQREIDRLAAKSSEKFNNENITFLDNHVEPIIEPQTNIIELTEEEKLHKANEIKSIIHQMFGKDSSNNIETTIIDDNMYEKFKWIFDLFDFL